MELNTREIAILTWTGALVAFVLYRPETRRSAGGVLRALLAPKIVAVLMALAAYVALCTALLAKLGVWDWDNLKTTIVWAGSFAFLSTMDANKFVEGKTTIRQLVGDAVNVTALVLFIAEFKTFALWIELLLVPSLTLVGMMLVIAQSKPEFAITVRPLTWLTSAAGFAIFGYGVLGVVGAWSEFASWATAREFIVPVLLTILFAPFLFGLVVTMSYESAFTGLSFWLDDPKLLRFARRHAILRFGLDRDLLKRWIRYARLHDVRDREAIMASQREIKAIKRRQAKPAATPPEEGWSPQAARVFLAHYGVVADDYHPAFGAWRAEAPSVAINKALFEARVSYYLDGVEGAVTQLKLNLHAYRDDESEAADAQYDAMASDLLRTALGGDAALPKLAQLFRRPGKARLPGGATLTYAADEWANGKLTSYARRLTITHPAHRETEWDLADA